MSGETPELKIPYPSESDNINEGATKITELAERVDLLLRKQLTKLLEVAKLKVTTTVELPAESITEAELKKEVVTDAKVGAGRALVKTGTTPGARTERAFATAFTPSASRMTFVAWDVQLEPTTVSGAGVEFYVDGVKVAEVFQQLTSTGVDSDVRATASYLVPPGQTWEAVKGAGASGGLHSSYLEL